MCIFITISKSNIKTLNYKKLIFNKNSYVCVTYDFRYFYSIYLPIIRHVRNDLLIEKNVMNVFTEWKFLSKWEVSN